MDEYRHEEPAGAFSMVAQFFFPVWQREIRLLRRNLRLSLRIVDREWRSGQQSRKAGKSNAKPDVAVCAELREAKRRIARVHERCLSEKHTDAK